MSQLYKVKIDEATRWIKGHESTYSVYHEWAQEIGQIAEVRGWASTPYWGRVRWVQEANSKGSGESPIRSAVNHSIQGAGADLSKMCLIALRKALKNSSVKLLNLIHDEVVIEAPGRAWINWEKSQHKNGAWTKLVWEYDEVALKWATYCKNIMEEQETILFQKYGSDIPGKCSVAIAKYWQH